MLSEALRQYVSPWHVGERDGWTASADGGAITRSLNGKPDSRALPDFFPSPECLVTTSDGIKFAVELVAGASIVNRFPYVVALSIARMPSQRTPASKTFMSILERSGCAILQYLPPGAGLDLALGTAGNVSRAHHRLDSNGLRTKPGVTSAAPVYDSAYMAYEATLVNPTTDFDGEKIYEEPWIDIGSQRVYFLEINAIQLRRDIAEGRSQIRWRSLPTFEPVGPLQAEVHADDNGARSDGYQKPYTPDYAFPSTGTIAFEADEVIEGMAVKYLPPLPEDQVEVDNDRARWPCFFPSSLGMITSWSPDGTPNLMPCGSTTVVGRNPLVISPCVSYAAINERYAPRATLELVRRSGRFGCGVPFINDLVVKGIKYAGNTSITSDPKKLANSGLAVVDSEWAPVLGALPVHYDCEVVGEVRLGTHIMFLGEVRRMRVRADVGASNPVEWCPWADVTTAPLAER